MFDIAKGIGIILVIIGHSGVPNPILHVIYSFHVPLFFIISGYFCKVTSIKETIIKSFKRYMLPYFITCLLVVFIKTIIGLLQGNGFEVFWRYSIASLYGASSNNIPGNIFSIEKIGAIWFLQALFWCEIFFTIFMSINNRIIRYLLLVGGYW